MCAWVVPPTFTVGEILTSTAMNQISGDLTFLFGGGYNSRKTTAKTVNNTVTETDLLNGEFTLAASNMTTTSMLDLFVSGDHLNNSGANIAAPRFKFKMGSGPTTIIDTGTGGGSVVGTSTGRYGWSIAVRLMNLGAANSQIVSFEARVSCAFGAAANPADFTTGEGRYGSYGNSTSASGPGLYAVGANTSAIDTTASQSVQLSVINGTANTNVETKLYYAIMRVI